MTSYRLRAAPARRPRPRRTRPTPARCPRRDRLTPRAASSGTDGPPASSSTLTGTLTASITAAMSSGAVRPGANTTSAPAASNARRRAIVSDRSSRPCRWFSARAVSTSRGWPGAWACSAAAATRSTACSKRMDRALRLAGGVLDREAGQAGVTRARRGQGDLGRVAAESVLEVRGDGHLDRLDQRRGVGEGLARGSRSRRDGRAWRRTRRWCWPARRSPVTRAAGPSRRPTGWASPAAGPGSAGRGTPRRAAPAPRVRSG